jgi:cyclic pyranopterin monophosphate synthase
MKGLTHLDERGAARMVDVGDKPSTARRAVASALVRMQPGLARSIAGGTVPKGDVLAVARVAGITAAKRTSELIPLCHPLRIDSVSIEITIGDGFVRVLADVSTTDRTGVEMEALTAASVAALTIYDMCKAVDHEMVIERVQLEHKDGGRGGRFERSKVGGAP